VWVSVVWVSVSVVWAWERGCSTFCAGDSPDGEVGLVTVMERPGMGRHRCHNLGMRQVGHQGTSAVDCSMSDCSRPHSCSCHTAASPKMKMHRKQEIHNEGTTLLLPRQSSASWKFE